MRQRPVGAEAGNSDEAGIRSTAKGRPAGDGLFGERTKGWDQSPATGSDSCCRFRLMGIAALLEAGLMESRLTRPSTGFSPRTCSR